MKISANIKRRLLQTVAFGYSNPFLPNLIKGDIYKGKFKNFCNPGMNCYSCPAASLACPIGAMQAVSGSLDFGFSFYAVGIILAIGAVCGRWICGFLCPFGFFQDIIAKIPLPKFKIPKFLTYIKYILLLVFVLILPVALTDYMGMGKPAYCEYICPVGTLEGGLTLMAANPELADATGNIFLLKISILVITLTGCLFIRRFFCKVLCPLGALYGLLNKISIFRLQIDKTLCINCGKCADVCDMDVDPVKECMSSECIRCGKCVSSCPKNALKISMDHRDGVCGPL
ncbi:MAG: 4Fe-4S binding protein [Lachnospiraceae bacterium]|nr:4Fe-4S binding protein [Lachnospiraceae bacterium]